VINRKIVIATVLALTISFSSGCALVNKSNPTENPGVGSKIDETVQHDIMKEFEDIINKEVNISDYIEFVDKNIESLTPENATKLITKLEELQKDYLDKLEKKYFDIEIQNNIIEAIKPEYDLENLKSDKIENAEVKELLKETEKMGYKVETAEGMFFPVIDYGFYEKYAVYVTEDMKDYIDIMVVESDKVPAKDAALVISWDELFERLFNQEKFLDEHKDSVKFEEIKSLHKKYMTFAIYGLNNTPLFDYNYNKMNDEAKAAYERVIAKESKLSQTLKEYYELIRNNGFKLTEEVKSYRDKLADSIK